MDTITRVRNPRLQQLARPGLSQAAIEVAAVLEDSDDVIRRTLRSMLEAGDHFGAVSLLKLRPIGSSPSRGRWTAECAGALLKRAEWSVADSVAARMLCDFTKGSESEARKELLVRDPFGRELPDWTLWWATITTLLGDLVPTLLQVRGVRVLHAIDYTASIRVPEAANKGSVPVDRRTASGLAALETLFDVDLPYRVFDDGDANSFAYALSCALASSVLDVQMFVRCWVRGYWECERAYGWPNSGLLVWMRNEFIDERWKHRRRHFTDEQQLTLSSEYFIGRSMFFTLIPHLGTLPELSLASAADLAILYGSYVQGYGDKVEGISRRSILRLLEQRVTKKVELDAAFVGLRLALRKSKGSARGALIRDLAQLADLCVAAS